MEDYEDSLKQTNKQTLKNIHYIFSTLAQTPMNIWRMEKDKIDKINTLGIHTNVCVFVCVRVCV